MERLDPMTEKQHEKQIQEINPEEIKMMKIPETNFLKRC